VDGELSPRLGQIINFNFIPGEPLRGLQTHFRIEDGYRAQFDLQQTVANDKTTVQTSATAASPVISTCVMVKFLALLPLRSRALSFDCNQAYFSRISTRRFLSSDTPFRVGTSGSRLPRPTIEVRVVSIPLALRIATTLIAR